MERSNIKDERLRLLARLIREVSGEDPEELVCNPKCSYKSLGRFISCCDYVFLTVTLRLADPVFSHFYPDIELSTEIRREFADALEAHCESCDPCRAKRGEDLALKAEVAEALTRDKTALREVIEGTVSQI
jgi:hypothetical protein